METQSDYVQHKQSLAIFRLNFFTVRQSMLCAQVRNNGCYEKFISVFLGVKEFILLLRKY